MSNILNQRAQEYLAVLRQKEDSDLEMMAKNLRAQAKAEKTKEHPDESLLDNYHWQYRIVQTEWYRRHPKPKPPAEAQKEPEKFQQVEAEIPKTEEKTFPDVLKEKTLEGLNAIREGLKTDFENLKLLMTKPEYKESRKRELTSKMEAVESEISTRSPKIVEEVKKDIAKLENKMKIWGIDRTIVISGAVGGGLGLTLGLVLGKNATGWTVLGLALGSGVAYFSKNQGLLKKMPVINKKNISTTPTVTQASMSDDEFITMIFNMYVKVGLGDPADRQKATPVFKEKLSKLTKDEKDALFIYWKVNVDITTGVNANLPDADKVNKVKQMVDFIKSKYPNINIEKLQNFLV